MGRRQHRLKGKQIQPENIRNWIGQKLDVITQNDLTFHGRLLAITPTHLTLSDDNKHWYNATSHIYTIGLENITEIIAIE